MRADSPIAKCDAYTHTQSMLTWLFKHGENAVEDGTIFHDSYGETPCSETKPWKYSTDLGQRILFTILHCMALLTSMI